MKGITYCGACADYDIKKHRCKRGAKLESNPQDKFFDDCPLPDAVPVVRCEDCANARKKEDYESTYLCDEVLICTSCEASEDGWLPVWPTHFCSYGERKEND